MIFSQNEHQRQPMLPAVGVEGDAPKGLGTPGHKPLMRNQRGNAPLSDGILRAALLFVLLILAMPSRGADALAVSNPMAGMVPAAALCTNALWVTCPVCGRVSVVPARKLMTTEASATAGGTIQTRSTLVKCKCGEMISARLKVFMPEPKIQLVPANGKAPVVTFTSPKVRAPSDTNSIR